MADLPMPIKDQVSEDEWKIRIDLAACYRICAHFGWDDLIFTHISARVPGAARHYLINPFGLLFDEITASNLVKVDLQGRIQLPNGHGINPAGFTVHSAIHEAREDAHCALHLHTTEGVAVSAQKKGLLSISQNAMTLYGDIGYHDYEGLALEEGERKRLAADIGPDKGCLILRNHGLLTVGGNVQQAFLRMYFLQRACEQQLAAQSGGAALTMLPDELGEKVAQQGRGPAFGGVAEITWQAVLRMIDWKDQSYKE